MRHTRSVFAQSAKSPLVVFEDLETIIMLFYLWIAALLVALALYFKQKYSYFNKYGVKHFKPLPLVGTMGKVVTRRLHFAEVIDEAYTKFSEEKFFGHYLFLNPGVIITDLELIKKVTVKDFEHFLDHGTVFDPEADPLFGRSLFSLKGQEWKDMRSTLSPAFTSSKIKHMVPFMVEVGNQMIKSLKKKLGESGSNSIDVEVRELATHYSNDVIASCAFGMKVDTHTDPANDFYTMGTKATSFGFKDVLKVLAYSSMPYIIIKRFKFSRFSEEVKKFFIHFVLNTMSERKAHNIHRPDMIHLLMEAKKGQLTHEEKSGKDEDAGFATVEESVIGKKSVDREWSDIDLVAQASLFYLAGYLTVSTAMTFLMYELAVNPEIQEKLVQEIRENEKANDGKFDYRSIQTMTYLDMVISEVLRLWPPAIASDRLCVKDYNLGKPNDTATVDYIVKANQSVNIPIFSVHRDPRHFPNPLKFDPERFSDENKHKIKPYTYMPFGAGPRNCIGSRFALCEVKVMIYQLLQNVKLEPTERTIIPVQLETEGFNLKMKGGHWLRMTPRE